MAPWSTFWDRNFFLSALPLLDRLMASNYLRGAVTGVGVVTVLAGLAELGAAFAMRRAESTTSPGPTLPSDHRLR